MKPYILSPDKTPMENLWDCVNYVCRSLLNRKRLIIKPDERDELLWEYKILTFVKFKNRVLRGEYDRNYALWQNAFYCAWGCWHQVWSPTKRHIINKINTVSCDDPLNIQSDSNIEAGSTRIDIIDDSLSNKLNYRHTYNDNDVRHEKLNIPDQRDAAYELYVEECYDLGIEPVDMTSYVLQNGGKLEWANTSRTYKEYRNELERERLKKKRESSKKWYNKNKSDPEFLKHRQEIKKRL